MTVICCFSGFCYLLRCKSCFCYDVLVDGLLLACVCYCGWVWCGWFGAYCVGMLCLFVLDRYCVLMLVCLVCLIAYGCLFVWCCLVVDLF